MIKPIAEKLTEANQSRYALCVGVAKRAREIVAEEEKNPDLPKIEKPIEQAVEELEDHEYRIVSDKPID